MNPLFISLTAAPSSGALARQAPSRPSREPKRCAIDGVGTAARFQIAKGIWGNAGQLYVADWGNNAIRRITIATGEVTTFAGSITERSMIDGEASKARFASLQYITSDGLNIYAADRGSTASPEPAVRKINIATGQVSTLAKTFAGPMWTDGELVTNDLTTLIGGLSVTPAGMWGDGNYLYVTNPFQPAINRIELATGKLTAVVSKESGQLMAPQAIWGDGSHLYVADLSAVRSVSADGFETPAPLSRSFDVVNRGGIAVETSSAGALKVGYAKVQADVGAANPSGVAIFEYRPSGVTVTEAAVPASPLVQGGRIYTEINGPANTGIALSNPNDQLATVSFFFTNAAGTNFGAGTVTVAPKTHVSKFLNEPSFSPGALVRDARSFTFSSSVPQLSHCAAIQMSGRSS